MCFRSPKAPPPQPTPAPAPPPASIVKEVKNPSLKKRKANPRKGGMRSLVINRTTPKIGSKGTGANY